MKIVSSILFLTLISFLGQAQETKLKRYEVKSGMVEYTTTVSGKIMGTTTTGSGFEKLYFKDWGAIELQEVESKTTTHTKFFGKESTDVNEVHSLAKLDNGKSYSVDFDKKEILVRNDIAMESVKTYKNGDAHQTGKEMLEALGGEKIGEETFLGYNCEVWTAMGTKMWIYKGLPLKTESNIMGMKTIKIATNAQFNTAVPDTYFKLPNYPIVKLDAYLNQGFNSNGNEGENEEESIDEREEMKANAKAMENMTFEEYKAMVIKEDPEAKNKSEQEFRQEYSLFKFMLKHASKL